MKDVVKNKLMSLDKEQLVKIVEDYSRCCYLISEVLVRHSKERINGTMACAEIRTYMKDYIDGYNFNHSKLSDYCDLQLGRITGDEYRCKMLSREPVMDIRTAARITFDVDQAANNEEYNRATRMFFTHILDVDPIESDECIGQWEELKSKYMNVL